MRIAIGSDHRGFALKQSLIVMVRELGHQLDDMGCDGGDAVDYPDYAEKVATAVSNGKADRGVLICGTGIGMSIAANKVPGVRAALCVDALSARMSREHNDSNVVCIGGELVGEWSAKETVKAYLEAEFQGGRHSRRVGKISDIESGKKSVS